MLYRVYIYQHCHIIRIFLYLTPSPPHLFRTAIHPEYNIQSRIVYTAPVNRNIAVNGWREKGIARTHVWRVLFAMRKTSWCGCGDAVLAVYVRESFVERQHRVSHRKKFITNLRASIYESAFYEGERNVGGVCLYYMAQAKYVSLGSYYGVRVSSTIISQMPSVHWMRYFYLKTLSLLCAFNLRQRHRVSRGRMWLRLLGAKVSV